ncbi:arad-like aldolase/epimerase [Dendrothele bispora CBS 962.96]|uniref:Arad-like aldolase/epimerase n=1 Tax=Dendrothele bispora (strain CBS 962.96) TaxID=1314807 RepID=A0A4S8L0Z1_DENBC|nr:arad-like aldolase/epimerase [Dendrothele bispora CBS 962.96]
MSMLHQLRSLAYLLLLPVITQVVSAQTASEPSANITAAAVDLLDANHILHFLDVVDAFGHISVRNPDNESQFIMSFAIAPALTTSQSLVTYEINNATAIQLTFNSSITGASVPSGFVERFIHSQIYAAFPNVTSVIHAHTLEVIPFAAAGVGLKAQMGTAGSVGALVNGTPIFDFGQLPTDVLPEDAVHDLLIRNPDLGDALAGTFVDGSEVVLMTGHGLAIRGTSIRNAVFRAFYTKQSATVQAQGLLIGGFGAGGTVPMGLSEREAMDAKGTNEGDSLLGRAWALWTAQVDREALYENDLRSSPSS